MVPRLRAGSSPALTDRWQPDQQLVPAVLAAPRATRPMADLAGPDRAWVVAGLTLAGMTAEEIADRLACSLRLVRTIRAEDMTAVCLLYQAESEHFADELRLARSEAGRLTSELADAHAQIRALRDQVARLIGTPLCRKCGEPLVGYNLYVEPGSKRRRCRNCHRNRQKDWRAKRSAVVKPAAAAAGAFGGHPAHRVRVS